MANKARRPPRASPPRARSRCWRLAAGRRRRLPLAPALLPAAAAGDGARCSLSVPKHCPPSSSPSVAGTISLSTSCSAGGGSWPPPAPSPCCPSSSSSVSGITSAPASCPSAMTAAWLAGCPPAAAASKAPPSSPSSACAAAAAASGEPNRPFCRSRPARSWSSPVAAGCGERRGHDGRSAERLPATAADSHALAQFQQTRITACAACWQLKALPVQGQVGNCKSHRHGMCGSVQLAKPGFSSLARLRHGSPASCCRSADPAPANAPHLAPAPAGRQGAGAR